LYKKAVSQTILKIALALLAVLIIYPFILLVSVSFSAEKDILSYGYSIIPKTFDVEAYRYVFKNPMALVNAYKVTTLFSVAAMCLGVFFMSMIAYVLSRKDLRGRNVLSFFLYFTMLFNGGLVPTYILMTKYLYLNDTIWVYILPGLISPWYVFMIRTFFNGIPAELSESVRIDGGNVYTIFFKIIIPLSKPVLATVALFLFLAKWNDWYTAMLYINKENLVSLQYLLQRILQNIQLLQNLNYGAVSSLMNELDIPAETVRMAMAVVVAGPALIVFPFFQKYFVRGLTVGGVKG